MPYLRFLLIIVLLVFLFPVISKAQTKIGFIAGTQQSGLTGDKYFYIPDSTRPRFSNIQGYRFAAFYNIKLNRFFSVRPEIAYSQKGGHQKLDSGYNEAFIPPGWKDTYKTSTTHRFNYLEIPIVANFSALLFKYGKGDVKKRVSLEIFAGGHFSYLMNNKLKTEITVTRTSKNDTTWRYNFSKGQTGETEIDNDNINRWDAGLIAGFGLKTQLTKFIDAYAEVRYTTSYQNINNGHWDRTVPDPNHWFNTVTESPTVLNTGLATFSAGVLLNFGKEGFHFKPAE